MKAITYQVSQNAFSTENFGFGLSRFLDIWERSIGLLTTPDSVYFFPLGIRRASESARTIQFLAIALWMLNTHLIEKKSSYCGYWLHVFVHTPTQKMSIHRKLSASGDVGVDERLSNGINFNSSQRNTIIMCVVYFLTKFNVYVIVYIFIRFIETKKNEK